MIDLTTAYGVLLTDDFGIFFEEYSDFEQLNFRDENIEKHFHLCYSAEDPQYVLGIHVEIKKNMDINAIHNSWLEHINALPENIKTIYDKLSPEFAEPDFQVLAGDY